MKPSHDLFDLVKSLSKNEKRYVTLFLSTSFHGSNKNSFRLFRLIGKQETYNEPALKKLLGTVFSKRFSAEKNLLTELILESMLLYYRDRTVEKRINALRYQSAFLFSKNLFPAGWRLLRKAKAQSDEHESFATGIQIAYRENLELRINPAAIPVSKNLQERNRQLLVSVEEELTVDTLYTQIIAIEKRFGTAMGSGAAKNELEKIIRNPLLNEKKKLQAFSAQQCRLSVLAVYYKMTGNDRKAFECFCEQVNLFESSPARIAQGYGPYSDALLNRLQHAVIIRDDESINRLLPETRRSLNSIKRFLGYSIDFVQFYGPDILELMAMKNRGDHKRGPAFLAQAEKNFLIHRSGFSREGIIATLYQLGAYNFYLGNLKKALNHFNDLTDSTSPETGQNYQCMVRLVKGLLFYDLGHTDLLPGHALAAKRLLSKHGRMGAFENDLISFFRKEPERGNKVQLKALLDSLQQNNSSRSNYDPWCEFDILSWVESRYYAIPLHEIIAGKNGTA